MKENKELIDIRNTAKIKSLALSGYDRIWLETASGEALILPKKYGRKWWLKAKNEDIRRVAIH